MVRIIGLLSIVISLSALNPTRTFADERTVQDCNVHYYFMLFAGAGEVLRPATAHVWATWVRATTLTDDTIQLHETTISFLPKTLRVRWWAVRPEPGFNLGLHETFQFMTPNHALRTRLSMWGPFEITAHSYDQGIRQKQHLDSGAVLFRSIDYFDQHEYIEHCLHAITAAYPELDRRAQRVRWYGDIGTAPIADQLQDAGVVKNCDIKHQWLIPALGLERYPIQERECSDRWPFNLR